MVIRELFARFGLKFEGRGADKFRKSVDGQIEGLRKLGGALAAVAGASALGAFVKNQIAAADAIDKASAKLGVSTDALQEYRHAAELTGVGAQTFDVALQRLTRRLDDAKRGAGPAADAFRRLGIDPRQIKDSEEALSVIADGLKATESQSERVALSFAFFDSEGVALTNTLQGGSEALEAMRQEARALGGVMDKELINESVALTDDLLRLEKGFQGVKNQLLRALLPSIDRTVNFMRNVSQAFRNVVDNSNLLEAVLGILGTAALVFGAKLLLPMLPFLALIAGVILLVDDLIALFSGGKSVIGTFIDAMFGAGTAKQVVEDLKFAWEQVPGAIAALIEWIKSLGPALTEISDFVLETLAGWVLSFEDFTARAGGAFDEFITWIVDGWIGAADAVSQFVDDALTLWDDFVRAVTTFPDAMRAVWDEFVGDAQRAFADLVRNLPEFLKKGAQVLGFQVESQPTARPRAPRRQRRPQAPPAAAPQAGGRRRPTPRPTRAGSAAVAAPGRTPGAAARHSAPSVDVPAPTVRLPAPAAGPQITQTSTTTINVDASGAGDPRAVAREVEATVRRVNEEDRRAAQAALTQRGGG